MNILAVISILIAVGFSIWRIVRRTRFFLHMLQLSGYKLSAYSTYLDGKTFDVRIRASHIVGAIILIVLVWMQPATPGMIAGFSLAWAFAFISSRRYRRDRPKKRLVWTARMKRLGGATLVVALIAGVAGTGLVWTFGDGSPWLLATLLVPLYLMDLGAPEWVRMAGAIMTPFERNVHEGFKRAASDRLAERADLTRIAITGSYGKTSVKFAVRDILSERFLVLATPGSFNTPMGISKVVNDQLTDDHRFAVLEMGMRHPGDIAELAMLAPPDIAVITSIGPAHLESMGSIEAIAEEKLSLLVHLTSDGTAVVNADDARVLAGAKAMAAERGFSLVTCSISDTGADLVGSDIQYGPNGAEFMLQVGSESIPVQIGLLGHHNVLNVILGAAVALTCGMRLRHVARAVRRIEPVPHRLALREEHGLRIIDDAFNSNPVGAASAVDVLSQFRPGRRVIVTPGMVELGDEEANLNRAFGKQIATSADDAVLVGPKRTAPIREGLLEAGFGEDRIHTVTTLFDAQNWVRKHCVPGDTVLYENDLPDQFTEEPGG